MTYKEAIKALEKELLYNLGTEKAEAYRMAIQAMEMQVEKSEASKRITYQRII